MMQSPMIHLVAYQETMNEVQSQVLGTEQAPRFQEMPVQYILR